MKEIIIVQDVKVIILKKEKHKLGQQMKELLYSELVKIVVKVFNIFINIFKIWILNI